MKVTFGLSCNEIEKAISELKAVEQRLQQAVKDLGQALLDKGIQIAKSEIVSLGAIDTGELESSINGYFIAEYGVGLIFTDCPYAIFVEYGTGVVGAEKPHPNPIGWTYDSNNHGESGWWYIGRNDDFRWTKGSPSKPFMYNTRVRLNEICKQLAKEKLGEVVK